MTWKSTRRAAEPNGSTPIPKPCGAAERIDPRLLALLLLLAGVVWLCGKYDGAGESNPETCAGEGAPLPPITLMLPSKLLVLPEDAILPVEVDLTREVEWDELRIGEEDVACTNVAALREVDMLRMRASLSVSTPSDESLGRGAHEALRTSLLLHVATPQER